MLVTRYVEVNCAVWESKYKRFIIFWVLSWFLLWYNISDYLKYSLFYIIGFFFHNHKFWRFHFLEVVNISTLGFLIWLGTFSAGRSFTGQSSIQCSMKLNTLCLSTLWLVTRFSCKKLKQRNFTVHQISAYTNKNHTQRKGNMQQMQTWFLFIQVDCIVDNADSS